MAQVITCESGNNPDAVGDFGTSYGLSQIHLPAHPEITKAEALDPDYAVAYMARMFSIGQHGQWTCYRMLRK